MTVAAFPVAAGGGPIAHPGGGSLVLQVAALRCRGGRWDPTKVIQRCLIVDDSRAFVSSARALLEAHGIEPACASCSEEALADARTSNPDFVLVDVELGGEDGFALARSLLAQNPCVRIVMTSAYEFDDLAELAAGCGAAGFIAKTALSAQAIRELLER